MNILRVLIAQMEGTKAKLTDNLEAYSAVLKDFVTEIGYYDYLKENEEPKIICDSVALARTNEECKDNPVAINNMNADNQHNYQPQIRNKNNNTQKPMTLYLRIDDLNTDKYNRAKRVLDIFDGRTPVIFYLTDTKRKVKAPSSMWVDINPVMIKELKYQLGDENVVAK